MVTGGGGPNQCPGCPIADAEAGEAALLSQASGVRADDEGREESYRGGATVGTLKCSFQVGERDILSLAAHTASAMDVSILLRRFPVVLVTRCSRRRGTVAQSHADGCGL